MSLRLIVYLAILHKEALGDKTSLPFGRAWVGKKKENGTWTVLPLCVLQVLLFFYIVV